MNGRATFSQVNICTVERPSFVRAEDDAAVLRHLHIGLPAARVVLRIPEVREVLVVDLVHVTLLATGGASNGMLWKGVVQAQADLFQHMPDRAKVVTRADAFLVDAADDFGPRNRAEGKSDMWQHRLTSEAHTD